MEEVSLKIRSLQFTKVLAGTGKWAMKKILLDEQFLFVHFRLHCAEREVHLLVLLDCPLLGRARSSGQLNAFCNLCCCLVWLWIFHPVVLLTEHADVHSKAQVLSLRNCVNLSSDRNLRFVRSVQCWLYSAALLRGGDLCFFPRQWSEREVLSTFEKLPLFSSF